MPTPTWAIEGLFEVNSLVMVAGPPGNYKSFLAIDWVMSMALGRKWHNKNTIAGKVLYCLGEGKSNLLKRIQAWTHYHGIEGDEAERLNNNFRVTFDVPQLAAKSSVDNMLAGLSVEEFTPNVLVVDTFARSFVGLDENSQRDTGLWIEQADRLRQLGYTVIFLHHTAKNTEFGLKYRGSTAIMGAMDTAFTLSKDTEMRQLSKLDCTKQKDHDEGDPLYFQRVIVRPNPKEEGSIVLVPYIRVDERFTPEAQEAERLRLAAIAKALNEVMKDPTNYSLSLRQKGEKLAQITGMEETAAYSRVQRWRDEGLNSL
jgi:RecA-family ATPase